MQQQLFNNYLELLLPVESPLRYQLSPQITDGVKQDYGNPASENLIEY